jgi:hypothetical protein|tara:strand:- start:921 stop:1028 length:108 start_codon:yes stop_codon:yes gene_type:complete
MTVVLTAVQSASFDSRATVEMFGARRLDSDEKEMA